MSDKLTAAEQKLLNYIDNGAVEAEEFRSFCDCALEYQSVVGFVDGVGSLLHTLKLEMAKVIEDRKQLQAEISKLRSDAGWTADFHRQQEASRAPEWR